MDILKNIGIADAAIVNEDELRETLFHYILRKYTKKYIIGDIKNYDENDIDFSNLDYDIDTSDLDYDIDYDKISEDVKKILEYLDKL